MSHIQLGLKLKLLTTHSDLQKNKKKKKKNCLRRPSDSYMKMNPDQSSVHPTRIEKYPFLFHTTFELRHDEIDLSSEEIFRKRACEPPGGTWSLLGSRLEPILETEEESPQPIQDMRVIKDLQHAPQPKEGSSSGSSSIILEELGSDLVLHSRP